jgi:hypothetical protein
MSSKLKLSSKLLVLKAELDDVFGVPVSSLRDLMRCEDVGSVAWFVHECIELEG